MTMSFWLSLAITVLLPPLTTSSKISLIRDCNNNSNNRNKLTMHLLNSSSITWCQTISNSNSNSQLFSRMASAAETSRIARVREERAPNMRTLMRRGISREGPLVAPTQTTADKGYPVEQVSKDSEGVAREATAIEGLPAAQKVNTMTLLIPPASPCPALIHRASSRHKSSHSSTSKHWYSNFSSSSRGPQALILLRILNLPLCQMLRPICKWLNKFSISWPLNSNSNISSNKKAWLHFRCRTILQFCSSTNNYWLLSSSNNSNSSNSQCNHKQVN